MRGFLAAAALAFSATWAAAQGLPRGTIVDPIACAGDPSQTYALYLPSTYTPDRPWSVLMGFHPAGRGRAIVELYRHAAERYGYIVAASNNSRNGPMAVSAAAVSAMSADLGQRFAIAADRVYLTGMSGGARVALQVALEDRNNIAGVIASSAGYPDSRARSTLRFPLFATAGTEDFNYMEMREVDRALKSSHRLAIFDGGHTLPPAEVAIEGIEWLELQAMKSGRRSRDELLIARLYEQRSKKAPSTPAENVHLLESLINDFDGLRDVAGERARLAELTRQPDVKKALARERSDDDAERRLQREIFELEAGLGNDETRQMAMGRLRDKLSRLARDADAAQDTPERARARRVLRSIIAGAGERVSDPAYQKLLAEFARRR